MVPTLPEECPDLEKVWWTVQGICGKCQIAKYKVLVANSSMESTVSINGTGGLQNEGDSGEGGETSSGDRQSFHTCAEEQVFEDAHEPIDINPETIQDLEPEIIDTPWGQRMKQKEKMIGYLDSPPYAYHMVLRPPTQPLAEYLGHRDEAVVNDEIQSPLKVQEPDAPSHPISRRVSYFCQREMESSKVQMVRLLGPTPPLKTEDLEDSDATGSVIVLAQSCSSPVSTKSSCTIMVEEDNTKKEETDHFQTPSKITACLIPNEAIALPVEAQATSTTPTPKLKRTHHVRWVRNRFVTVDLAEAEQIDDLTMPTDRQTVLASLPRHTYQDPEKVNWSCTLEEGRDIDRLRRQRGKANQKVRKNKMLAQQIEKHVDQAIRMGEVGKIRGEREKIGEDMKKSRLEKQEKRIERKRSQSSVELPQKVSEIPTFWAASCMVVNTASASPVGHGEYISRDLRAGCDHGHRSRANT
jgi:hypothetical protein